MAKVRYSVTSPYSQTDSFGNFLDVMVNRPITAKLDDVLYEIDKTYEFRPDVLAYHLYDDATLHWDVAQPTPDVLKDPLFDFRAGKVIYIPKKVTLQADLGV